MDRMTPQAAYNAVKEYGSIRAASIALGVPRSTLGRHYRKHESQRTECTLLAMYDGHFPHEDKGNIEIAIDYAKTNFKINRLLLGGDWADFHSVSRWKGDPYEDMPFHEEIAYCEDGLADIASQFNGCEKYYVKGNHEDRLERFMWTRAPEISKLKGMTVEEQLGLSSSGYKYIDNLKIKEDTGKFFSIGKLHFLHGHELGICPSVNPARRYFMKAFDNMVAGHVHKSDEFYQKTLEDKTYGVHVVGPLCDMNPGYRPQNDWVAGFAVVEFRADGYYKFSNYKIIDGRVL